MPLRVETMVQYLTASVPNMRPRDYSSLMVVKAVKGRPVGGIPTTLTYLGKSYAFGSSKPGPAVDLWVAWAANQLQAFQPSGQFVIVPVPNSSAVHGTSPDFPTARLAELVANAVGSRSKVATELWWDEVMVPAHKNGPRFAHHVFPHLVAEESEQEGPRILLDDVITSGGHLRACAAKLREIGNDPQHAICCGRTEHEQLDDPFDVPLEELSDFDPENPFGFTKFVFE